MASKGVLGAVAFSGGGLRKYRKCIGLLQAAAVMSVLLALPAIRREALFKLQLASSCCSSYERTGRSQGKDIVPQDTNQCSDSPTSNPLLTASNGSVALPGNSASELAPGHRWLHSPMPSGGTPHALVTDLLTKHANMQQRMTTGRQPLKATVVKCTDSNLCGGLGDRMFGILTLFAAAVVTGRAFFIEHSKPVPQADYLQPYRLNWSLSCVEHASVRKQLKDCVHGKACSFKNVILTGGVTHRHACVDLLAKVTDVSDPIVVISTNMRTDCLLKVLIDFNILPENHTSGWKRADKTQLRVWAGYVSHLMLQHLFQFSKNVIEKGKLLLRQAPLPTEFADKTTENCLLCVHVRSGKNTSEGDRHHNVAAFGDCAHKVEKEMAKTCPRNVVWLVISDHPEAAEIVGRNHSRPLSTNDFGPIIHNDKLGVGEKLRPGADRLYVDYFLLTRCKYLVASLSTMGETASMWRGLSVRRYDMEHNHGCSGTPNNIDNWQRDVHLPDSLKENWL